MEKDCPKGFEVLFHYNQTGHQKVECPHLIQGSAQGSALATLCATESQPAKVETPRVCGGAF